jgi:DNA primase catalytic core
MHGCTFLEAIEIVAERIGFNIAPYYRELTPAEQLREDQYAVLGQVAELFHQALLTSPQHINFFSQRGIERDTLATFKIGYCPSLAWLKAQVDQAVLNIMDPNEGNRNLIFDGNLLYPQFTPAGQVWGWYARMPQGTKPKYLGTSSDAPLFEGKARLYGLTQARKLLRKSDLPLLVVEGFHDAMAAQQSALAAIATCGTELSTDQVQALHAHAIREAIVIFDGDDGGAKGMLRLAERAHEINGTNLKFLTIPGDPDEFIVGQGREVFVMACKEAVCAIEFVVQHYANLYRTTTPTQNLDFLNHVKPFLVQYPRKSLQRAIGVKSVAHIMQIDPLAITDFLEENHDQPLVNIRAELIVLAEFAMNPQAWILYPDVTPTDFILQRHARTFDLMMQCYQLSGQVNVELLLSEAHNRRFDHSIMETIQQLPFYERSNQETFVKDIRDKSLRRQSQALATDTARKIADLQTPASDTLGNFFESVTEILSGRESNNVKSSVQATEIAVLEFERRSESDQEIAGLDLGAPWSHLMSWTNGLQPQRQHLVCAVSGVGKSVVAGNWVHRLSIADDGPKVAGLIMSGEMSEVESIFRLAAIDSRVPHFDIEHARFDSEEQAVLVRSSFQRIRDARLTWMCGQHSMREIALQSRILQARGELEYIVIDYIQLVDVSSYNDRWSTFDKFAQASDDILNLITSLKVPGITVAQLNRKAYEEAIPTGEHIADCYDIYRDAHVCYTLAPRTKSTILGYLDKNRGGASGKGTDLIFDQNEQTSNLIVKESRLTANGPPQ